MDSKRIIHKIVSEMTLNYPYKLFLMPFRESNIDVIIQWRAEEHLIRQVLVKLGSY